ncbi:hypothetical protein PPL_10928 [Heterostelium album PN500]|uniref:Uncharacterized protein n=1 Tax=Heterostelium pallidum (strain ATCC 26659 / Pp 5 / PN500) TaxID=670386 RepID=D3BSG0_HETP5|nr:hypothetical protein PPL_10928 [Heterostelium album PN500]EFA75666.1 hypothetical protein PPL_10928 [Heterostelium album PN500]|eukprot:XP_020427800.1 hypothetical protein PPL_10928 [Heterostelium album PN500]
MSNNPIKQSSSDRLSNSQQSSNRYALPLNTPQYGAADIPITPEFGQPPIITQPYFQEVPMGDIQLGAMDLNSQPYSSSEKHVHYDTNPKVFFLPPDKPVKIVFHNFTNSLTSILQAIFIPLITTFLITLIPVGPLSNTGFLNNWLYNITFVCSLVFSLVNQFSAYFPLPIYIFLLPLLNLTFLSLMIYLRSARRFTPEFNAAFRRYFVFLVLCTLVIAVSIGYVIAFSYKSYQILTGVVYYIIIFFLNHCVIQVTRSGTSKGTHNVISYWVETMSEMVFLFMLIKVVPVNFYILLAIKLIATVRYPFFLTDRYWNWRNDVKDKLDQKGIDFSFSVLGLLLPVSIERDEHKTRVVDRFFFTVLCYCGVPLYYILVSLCVRWSPTAKFYPYLLISENDYIWLLIYAFFCSFTSFMSFLVIRYLFQVKFHLSVLNHPMLSLKNNVRLFMFCNFSALLLPITFMLLHNNVYYLVNSK